MQRALLLLVLLAGCDEINPEEKARCDARDVAMVEAAQQVVPPPIPLAPQALDARDLDEARCTFADPAHAARRPIVAIDPTRAGLRLQGRLEILASDPGATRLPGETWSHYVGKRYALKLEPQPTPANPTPRTFSTAREQPVALTITDEHDRKVLEAVGDLTCS